MNDADLEKLSVKPGKLEPKFDRDITEYNVTLPSIVTKISITPLTRDSDATWTIQGHGTVRNIPITQGEGKDVIIEVTAEDGSTKQYTIHFNSLSPSDASFKDIEISVGRLTPAFQTEILKYTAYVPWFVESVRTRTSSADKDMKGGNAEYDTILSYGETVQDLQVESVDKTNIRIYQISFIKERILRHINPVGEFNKSLICAICLGFVHCPNAIKTSEVNVAVGGPYFCKTCISPITKTRKIHPILEIPLPNDHLQPAYDLEEKVANLHVNCTYSSAGCIAELPLKELGKHMKDCGYRPIFLSRYDGVIPYREKDNVALVSTDSCTMCGHLVHTDEMTIHLKYYCPAKHANTRFKHVVKLRNWEKSLHDKVIGDDVDNAFFDSALELKMALCNYAKVTKMKPTKWENHFHLAMCFEEMHFAEDIHGLKLKGKKNQLHNVIAMAAKLP